jgi:hypothetical protein
MDTSNDLVTLCDSILKEQTDASKNIEEMMALIVKMREELEKATKIQLETKRITEIEQGEYIKRAVAAESDLEKARSTISEYKTKCEQLEKDANAAYRRRDIVIKMFDAYKKKNPPQK